MNRLKEECSRCRWFLSGTCSEGQDVNDDSRCFHFLKERRKASTPRRDRREKKE